MSTWTKHVVKPLTCTFHIDLKGTFAEGIVCLTDVGSIVEHLYVTDDEPALIVIGIPNMLSIIQGVVMACQINFCTSFQPSKPHNRSTLHITKQ